MNVDIDQLVLSDTVLWSPFAFAALVGAAAFMIWLALKPASLGAATAEDRLDSYAADGDAVKHEDMAGSYFSRVIMPGIRGVLRFLGTFSPQSNLQTTERMLVQAGHPGGLSVLDFLGLRILLLVGLGGGYFLLVGRLQPFNIALRNALILGGLGYFLPMFWLRRRVRKRQHEIARALPDALDMITIGVEAGLAFDSALLQVGLRWDNALTRELRRAVAEMRVGTPRDEALWRMADRTGVEELRNFVAVLVQSSQLGTSIAQVLHTQAAQERLRRRQRAEELARQAGGKMVFPLVFFILPALFVVILGPSVSIFMDMLDAMRSSVPRY